MDTNFRLQSYEAQQGRGRERKLHLIRAIRSKMRTLRS